MDYVEVPAQRLEADVFQAVLEDFIGREGTDYGAIELSMEQKLARLKSLIVQGEVCIVFDTQSESCTLMEKSELQALVNPGV